MNNSGTKWVFTMGAGVILATAAVGCRGAQSPASKEASSTAITQPRIQPIMRSLASQVGTLNRLLVGAPPKIESIDETLTDIDTLAEDVGRMGAIPNHGRLSEEVRFFREYIRDARLALDETPPNLLPAANVSGACLACHSLRDCPFDPDARCIDATH